MDMASNSPFVENKDFFKLLGLIVSYTIDTGYHIKCYDIADPCCEHFCTRGPQFAHIRTQGTRTHICMLGNYY